jgi:uncharacterized protein YjbI with pentapeptide repeats
MSLSMSPDMLRTLITAGAVVVVGYLGFRISAKTLAEQHIRTLNERFATAADKLGSDKSPAVRLAGVVAMAGLADDWTENRQACVDVLCAYLRIPYEPDPGEQSSSEERLAFEGEREVRHTVIRLITAHLRLDTLVSWRGLDFDFSGVVFDGGDFTDAEFSGGTVSFARAEFSGDVSFGKARFFGGRVSFAGAEFSGGAVDFRAVFGGSIVLFSGAKFSGGTVSFAGVHFASNFSLAGMVYFDDAKFSGGRVSFNGAKFFGGRVSFAGAEFCGAMVDFDDAEFLGGVVNFRKADIEAGDLFQSPWGPVSFAHAKFSGGTVSFAHVKFSGGRVSFAGAEFSGAMVSFDDAEFSGGTVSFAHAEFSGGRVSFVNAKFSGSEIDFSDVAVWWHPPTFGRHDAPPEGVLLPKKARHSVS